MVFWRFRAATQVCIIHKEAPRYYHYVHFVMTVIKVLYFIPNSRKSNSNSDRFSFYKYYFVYCEHNNLLFSTFLLHSIWWNGLHIIQRNLRHFVRWCCHLRNRFTTPSTNLRWLMALIDFLYFYAPKQLLLSSRLSHRNSVRPSVCLSVRPSHGWISQKRCKLGLPKFYLQLHAGPKKPLFVSRRTSCCRRRTTCSVREDKAWTTPNPDRLSSLHGQCLLLHGRPTYFVHGQRK